jgi:uncharacterized membrane protein
MNMWGGPGVGIFGGMSLFFIALLVWSLFWKGLALWHAAKRHEPWWFVIILVVNTAGILEIIYLFIVAKVKPEKLFKN